jgi:ABC-2 type transport system ATP-binding protein
MKQRLGLASALLCDPQTVILDEPLNGLDSDGIRWVRDLTRQLADSGKTVLLASHFMSEVENTADRVVVLGNGHVLADADSAELLGQLGVLVAAKDTEALIRLLSTAVIDFQIGAQGISCRGVAARDVGELAAAGGLALTHLSELRETIEDAYLRILESAVEVTADA